MKEQSRSPLPRCCARATVFPRPNNSASLHPWWYSLLHHRSNLATPTRLRLPTHVPWHRLRGLRSYNQGGSLLSHKPDTPHPAPAVCVQWLGRPRLRVRLLLVQWLLLEVDTCLVLVGHFSAMASS